MAVSELRSESIVDDGRRREKEKTGTAHQLRWGTHPSPCGGDTLEQGGRHETAQCRRADGPLRQSANITQTRAAVTRVRRCFSVAVTGDGHWSAGRHRRQGAIVSSPRRRLLARRPRCRVSNTLSNVGIEGLSGLLGALLNARFIVPATGRRRAGGDDRCWRERCGSPGHAHQRRESTRLRWTAHPRQSAHPGHRRDRGWDDSRSSRPRLLLY